MGVLTAVGGGILRDVLITSIPTVLTKEIYASAALIGAILQILGEKGLLNGATASWSAIIVCSSIRLLSLKFKWNLPAVKQIR